MAVSTHNPSGLTTLLGRAFAKAPPVSDRMTGGPTTAGCLTAWEPDGMAEGWSDIFAATLTIKPDEDRDSAMYGFASWPLNKTDPATARLRMYSTNMDVNEFTYSSANGLTAVHQVGTVWATMLYEVLWNLIDKHGKNDSPRPDLVDGVPTDGKFLTLKLLTDAFSMYVP
jgi:extracellular elastinolytic metalloproteinase